MQALPEHLHRSEEWNGLRRGDLVEIDGPVLRGAAWRFLGYVRNERNGAESVEVIGGRPGRGPGAVVSPRAGLPRGWAQDRAGLARRRAPAAPGLNAATVADPRVASALCRSLGEMDSRPIGMFDSGFGGLTVARALIDLAPHEELVYVGDTGRYPYGPRDLDEVRSFAVQIARWLIDEIDVKLIVVACNTASAAALDALRALVRRPRGRRHRPRRAGAGQGHAQPPGRAWWGRWGRSGRARTSAPSGRCPVPLELVPASCPGFVEFVERGETRSDQVAVLAERLLAPVRDAGVDALLLGCTHYPFLARTIADVMGRDVVLVSSADETAFEVRAILARLPTTPRPAVPGAARSAGSTCGCSRRATWSGSGPWGAGSSAGSSARCGRLTVAGAAAGGRRPEPGASRAAAGPGRAARRGVGLSACSP